MDSRTDRPGTWAPPFEPGETSGLSSYPLPEDWDDWMELDARAWPRRLPHHYELVPTICFNCEAACGLLAYVDKESGEIRKFEGNPAHPGSRGRNCAKGPATINQVRDPDRILHPMRRTGRRGEGKWERITWDEALDLVAKEVRSAIVEERRTEIMYHVGRPGEDGFTERVLAAWGVDGHNSHTNVCSSGARTGYAFWMGVDRPSPDFAHAKFILLISAHLETGHYFNPHAQRIMEAKKAGAKLLVIDPRLSNTASHADYWLPLWPGDEGIFLLGIAHVLLEEGLWNRSFVERWTNWEEYLRSEGVESPTFARFEERLKEIYAAYTPSEVAAKTGVDAKTLVTVAREIGAAGTRFASHIWRAAAAGNLGGWQIARALFFLNVLTGAVGTPGGTIPNLTNKFVPHPPVEPPPVKVWNRLTWPKEFPLAHNEMSFLLPHFLKEGRGRLSVYFTRVYNPVWTNPDGFSWIEMLTDEEKVGLHVALTPTWSETAQFADLVLPMGLSPERHDLVSYETHAAQWIAFRQPVHRVLAERHGKTVTHTYEVNPGEVWEENEWWIELSWRVDPDGSLGIRKNFESPYRPGEKITVEEYYRWIFENSVPGLPEAAAKEGLTPLQYMRRYSAFEVRSQAYEEHEAPVSEAELEGAQVDPVTGLVYSPAPPPPRIDVKPYPKPPDSEHGRRVGILVDGVVRKGFPTPSGRLEFFSPTLRDWGWPEFAIPATQESHVHPSRLDREAGEMVLNSTFRLPTLIHTRSANAKWLYEISNQNPALMNPEDASRLGLRTGDLIRVTTETGYFVDRLFVTEGLAPGIIACSHHLGRWRLGDAPGVGDMAASRIALERAGGVWRMRQTGTTGPYRSSDPDTERIWWKDSGVHQNLTFPVHPDPVSGAHAWHQIVTVTPAREGDRYGDIEVDTGKAHAVFRAWMARTRPGPGPGGLRRPMWLLRPLRPVPQAYLDDTRREQETGQLS